jgi:hypothetical protein
MDGVYKVPNELGDAVNKDAGDFREKHVFDFAQDDPDKVEYHDGANAIFLTHNGEDYWSGDSKKMDPVSVQDFLRPIRSLTATKFATSGFSAPDLSLVVTSKDGKHVEKVEIAKSGNDYLARRSDGSALFVLDGKSIDEMRKAAGDLKPVEPPPTKK